MVRARLPISMQIGLVNPSARHSAFHWQFLAAFYHNRLIDQVIVGASVFVNAVPIFVTGPILLYFLWLVWIWMDVPFGWK